MARSEANEIEEDQPKEAYCHGFAGPFQLLLRPPQFGALVTFKEVKNHCKKREVKTMILVGIDCAERDAQKMSHHAERQRMRQRETK